MRFKKRASGILLHITCLPSRFGIGDLGPSSYQFVDRLTQIKQTYWSILPLTPTSTASGNSPYQGYSAFAGNTLLISPELLVDAGLLSNSDLQTNLILPKNRVDYQAVTTYKGAIIKKAYANFVAIHSNKNEFEAFCAENSDWLDDYALYETLKEKSAQPWFLWPQTLKNRDKNALSNKVEEQKEQIEQEKFEQFTFFSQWHALKKYCEKTGVSIIGDMPFYVSYDSAEVWCHSEIFELDAEKKPRFVSGVPPDYFSKTGQLWGNPVYNWRELKATGFRWWIDRLDYSFRLFDFLRLDHFRGFVAFWQVQAPAKDARIGKWVNAPAKEFFGTVVSQCGRLPLIAEDLGLITDDVRAVMDAFDIPGMRVLLFAFSGDPKNIYLPQNHPKNAVSYTGTHDTNTAKGWFTQEATAEQKELLNKYAGKTVTEDNASIELVKLAMSSKADLSIIPIQDALSFGVEARMNHPAAQGHNWEWRITLEQLNSQKLDILINLTKETNRA